MSNENAAQQIDDTRPLIDRLKEFGELKRQKDTLEKAVEELSKKITSLQPGLVEEMKKQEIKNMRIEGLGLLTTVTTGRPSLKEEFRQEAFKWMRENGLGDLVKETIHPQTLLGLVNERLKDNQELPPHVEVFYETKVQLRRE